MRAIVTIAVEDEDTDPTHDTGLTEPAWERLVNALSSAGFGFDSVHPD